MGLTVFLPCRAGSERVPHKNTRWFAGSRLIDIKLAQLESARLVDRVIVSTDDPWIQDHAEQYAKVSVHERDPALCKGSTSTDELIPHAVALIPDGDILWTHCTSPFVGASLYDAMIEAYRTPGIHDSLMSVERVQGFYWSSGVPINYSRRAEKWPRTQTIPPMYRVTSGAFIASAEAYRQGDRIGKQPMMFDLNMPAALDIDTPQDFMLAEHLYLTL